MVTLCPQFHIIPISSSAKIAFHVLIIALILKYGPKEITLDFLSSFHQSKLALQITYIKGSF